MSSPGTPDSPSQGEGGDEQLSDEERADLEQAAAQVAAIRAQLAAAPVELVVTNHVMGLYELAAVHLDREDPNLAAARLAIDALGGLLDACAGRLGDNEQTLVGARSQIQLAYVAVMERQKASATGPSGPASDDAGPEPGAGQDDATSGGGS